MANQLYQGYVYDDAGAAIVGATVNLYTRNTTTPVQATTTTDANGLWAISHATEGRFDIEIVNGTSKRRRKYDDQIQVDTIEVANLRVRNPADTFDYDIVPAAITADRQLNLPLITATDTLPTLGLAQTFSAVQTFSAIPEITGGAVGFPATQVASADANDLDDYEEGSWTPTIVGTITPGTQTYTTQVGRYTKLGSLIVATCDVVISAKDAGISGNIAVGGLPFASENVASAYWGAAIGFIKTIDHSAGFTQLTLILTNNTSQLIVYENGDNAGSQAVGVAALAAASEIVMTICYRV